MTSLDDQLHELFRTAASPVDGQGGDLRGVRAAARRRQLRQRASVLAVAATFVAVVGTATVVVGGDEGDDGVDISDQSTMTTDPRASTTSEPTTTTSTEPEPPPRPSIRDVDFGNLTYPAPCPAYDDNPITLTDGVGRNELDGAAVLDAELSQVDYADVDRDGNEDAVVAIDCIFGGASTDTGLLAIVFQPAADGQPEQLGEALTLEHSYESSIDGTALTVRRDAYDADDAACCPSSAIEEVWRFDGTAFQRESHRNLPPRSGELRPPNSQTPAAGTCPDVTEPVVEVVINPDIPSPRCVRVTSTQRLQIRNGTEQDITVTLGRFNITVAPGDAELLDLSFGDYLQPGVHVVTVPIYGTSGPEIWLVI